MCSHRIAILGRSRPGDRRRTRDRDTEQLLSLRLRRELRERAGSFVLPELCLGVHLRRGDAVAEFQLSRDEHFQEIMSALLREFPAIQFSLGTDESATAERYFARYEDRVLQLSKAGGGRQHRQGMEESLVDLFLLSRTRGTIGNNFSTFSHAAAALGRHCGPFLPLHPQILLQSQNAFFRKPRSGLHPRSASFCRAIVRKVELILQAIEDSWGEMFVWCDVDSQFFRPFGDVAESFAGSFDIAFHIDAPGRVLCDVIFQRRAACQLGSGSRWRYEEDWQVPVLHPSK